MSVPLSFEAAPEPAALTAARRVLGVEARALDEVATALDERFVAVVERLARLEGRVILSGMGKSAHVARKIAATLASTGTPAFFVHAAEASHGDLGMITEADLVVALSNSGETPELADLITFTRRYGIPLVAMVGREPSTLANAADFVLCLPPLEEACPMGLAPTTSTTAMLALGDALAAALMTARGFTASDFARFHPGGKLGSRLVRVRDIMHVGEAMPLVRPTTRMAEAIVEMTGKRLGCAGVLEDGRLVGIITDGDMRRHLDRADLLEASAGEVMTPAPRTIGPDALAAEALAVMNGRETSPITQLFVIENERPVGVLHLHDCLRAGVA